MTYDRLYINQLGRRVVVRSNPGDKMYLVDNVPRHKVWVEKNLDYVGYIRGTGRISPAEEMVRNPNTGFKIRRKYLEGSL